MFSEELAHLGIIRLFHFDVKLVAITELILQVLSGPITLELSLHHDPYFSAQSFRFLH